MSHKRRGSSNHYDSDRSKIQRQNNPHYSNNAPLASKGQYQDGFRGRPHQAPQFSRKKDNVDYINKLTAPEKCDSCKLVAAEMQTGTIALLEKLEAEEMTPDGDRDVLHHARELRRLLSNRVNKSQPSQTQRSLDEKRPAKDKYVTIPAWIEQKLEASKNLPPLPPITEPYLEEAVFTHISAYGSNDIQGKNDVEKMTYERLEFLGDAYIELISSRLIYSRLPHVEVAQQSTFREQLVKNETLGRFSDAYFLPDRMKHGGHIKESKAWTKITADVFEAYVAAVVLSDPENGFKVVEKWLTELWTPQLLGFRERVIENPKAKDDLQRLVQMKDTKLHYREEKPMVYDDTGTQVWFYGVYLTGWGYKDEWLGSGEGRSKAQACVHAAMDALKKNSVVLQTAAKKKQELVQLKKEEQAQAGKEEEKHKATEQAKVVMIEAKAKLAEKDEFINSILNPKGGSKGD